jgi:hypothetical protein
MKTAKTSPRSGFRPRPVVALIATIALLASSLCAVDLPFDRKQISRYSLDHLPRSLSILQGTDVWLGYDLERAKVYKVWRAPAGKPGLVSSGFVTKSTGQTWFEDVSGDTWELQRAGTTRPLTVRYLGCTQREDSFELTWELRHGSDLLTLHERVPRSAPSDAERIQRELRVENLTADEILLPPPAGRDRWAITSGTLPDRPGLAGSGWHRLTLR